MAPGARTHKTGLLRASLALWPLAADSSRQGASLHRVAHARHFALALDPLHLDLAEFPGVADVRPAARAADATHLHDAHPTFAPQAAVGRQGVEGADGVELLRIDLLHDRGDARANELVHRRLKLRHQRVALRRVQLAVILDVGARRELRRGGSTTVFLLGERQAWEGSAGQRTQRSRG